MAFAGMAGKDRPQQVIILKNPEVDMEDDRNQKDEGAVVFNGRDDFQGKKPLHPESPALKIINETGQGQDGKEKKPPRINQLLQWIILPIGRRRRPQEESIGQHGGDLAQIRPGYGDMAPVDAAKSITDSQQKGESGHE